MVLYTKILYPKKLAVHYKLFIPADLAIFSSEGWSVALGTFKPVFNLSHLTFEE